MNINEKCYFLKLKKISRMVTKIFDFSLHKLGIRGAQLNLLVGLSGKYETLTELSETLGMDRSTLTRNLIPLEMRGYIKQTEAKDRRSVHYELTKKGAEVVRSSYSTWKAANDEICNILHGSVQGERMISDGMLDLVYHDMSEKCKYKHYNAARY